MSGNKPTKHEVEKYSYLCNASDFKCPGSKWKKVKSLYCRKKNFDFDARTKNLLDSKSIFDKLGITFFLTEGAVLGAYRNNDYILWDDDVELDIFEEVFLERYDEICKAFMDESFIVRGKDYKFKSRPGEKFNAYRRGEKITVRGLFLDPSYRENEFRLTNVYQYPRKFYENVGTIDFKGATFRVPTPIEEYLVYCYGEEWKTPIKDQVKLKLDGINRGVRRDGR